MKKRRRRVAPAHKERGFWEETIHRRTVLKGAAARALAGPSFLDRARPGWHRQDRRGRPRTGLLASGAAVTHWPNFSSGSRVNSRGGLKLKGGQRKVELIEYDDRSQPGETIKAVERLATQDKVDFIVAPYGTGYNLAAAPVFAKYGYPQVTSSRHRPDR